MHTKELLDDKLLSPGEVANVLSVSRWTIYHWISSRQIRSVKIGRLVRIPSSEIARLIEENTNLAESG